MIDFFKNNLLWHDGRSIAIFIAIFAIISFFIYKPLLILPLGLFIFSLYFFRNPERYCPEAINNSSILICPADGKVVDISKYSDPNHPEYTQKISIFLSAFDVHVNWVPQAGLIKEVNYRPGKFIVAYAPKSSDINERNDVIIQLNNGKTIEVRQIAGIVARRICCWVKKEDAVNAGQKFGMIRFGSRVDILLPNDVNILLTLGQKVKGGQTVLGRFNE